MEKYVIFGAGNIGRKTLNLLGRERVLCFIDNCLEKQGSFIEGKEVISFDSLLKRKIDEKIVIAVSEDKYEEIEEQLCERRITNFCTFAELIFNETRKKLLGRTSYLEIYRKAIGWINNHTNKGEGIICTSNLIKSYPEVSGYYIPTLLRWGYKDLAIQYAKWLCKIQHDNGAWYDTECKNPYIFDSAQILKGLLAIRESVPEADICIIKGCDWILSNMSSEGRLVSPLKEAWGDGKTFSELIHTYCISPIMETGKVFGRADYVEKAELITDYYTNNCKDQILNFDLLSHFYAYIMEAMIDIGHEELAKEAMTRIASLQKDSGAVPGYNNVDWVCSTGLFQLALVWYRLGNIERGDKAFEYACRLQNKSGGWFGSYLSEENPDEVNTYFPDAEISWANKYFLDALFYKNLSLFEVQSSIFEPTISFDDGRYQCIEKLIEGIGIEGKRVLDIGCGKGRYLRNLSKVYPANKYYACDLSSKVMDYFEDIKIEEKKQGVLTSIPYRDGTFDITYTCEALEHAVDIKSAVRELCRVTRKNGIVAILDKNREKLGRLEIEEWEQWFDEEELKGELLNYCSSVQVIKDIDYEEKEADGLFFCWVGIKK